MKTITFAVPCYNSSDYMDKCIQSLLSCGDDIEILIVNDGSTDDTAVIASGWQRRFPDIVRAINKPNGGHGSAVNTGLAEAQGLYYKVVDSDDWLDADAMKEIMDYLRTQAVADEPTDLVVANYVYEKVFEDASSTMRYRNVFPIKRQFAWEESGTFNSSHYLLMHSVVYRTQLLRDVGLKLPEHTFYVDNIFVYVPLPAVKSIYYLDVDMYHYFIGREGQSVQEETMMRRIDQQIRITKIMIDAVDVEQVEPKKLRKYIENYLAMMMCICSVFLRMRNTPEDDEKLDEIWAYLKSRDSQLYKKIRYKLINLGTNMPTELGRKAGLTGYHLAQKIFKFN